MEAVTTLQYVNKKQLQIVTSTESSFVTRIVKEVWHYLLSTEYEDKSISHGQETAPGTYGGLYITIQKIPWTSMHRITWATKKSPTLQKIIDFFNLLSIYSRRATAGREYNDEFMRIIVHDSHKILLIIIIIMLLIYTYNMLI